MGAPAAWRVVPSMQRAASARRPHEDTIRAAGCMASVIVDLFTETGLMDEVKREWAALHPKPATY
jgi:hypothetical protein